MALSKDWREFLELLNFRGVDYADLAALEANISMPMRAQDNGGTG